VAGFALGAATALMGEKAAMACTAAVEETIEKHYGAQADELDPVEPALSETVRRFREEEIGHLTAAQERGAEDATGYPILRRMIGAGCRLAIRISEKI